MKQLGMILLAIGMLWPGISFAQEPKVLTCTEAACTFHSKIDAGKSQTYVGKCGVHQGQAGCKPGGSGVSCDNGGAKDTCSCTNESTTLGYAEVHVFCG